MVINYDKFDKENHEDIKKETLQNLSKVNIDISI